MTFSDRTPSFGIVRRFFIASPQERHTNGRRLVYFEEEPGGRAAANLLARDEARRIALDIAKLPELL
jgi:Family of unknown function (DUF6481)